MRKMTTQEIENFVEDKRNFIKEFFEKNPQENVFTVLFELTNNNLNIIDKFKNDYQESNDEQEKIQLIDMIDKLIKCVTDSLSTYP